MKSITDFPLLVFAFSFITMSTAILITHKIFKREGAFEPGFRETFNLVQGSTLSLLALLIGFSFSMSVGNYDTRTKYEEAEAKAINTAYKRFDFLPDTVKPEAKITLQNYLNLRISFYHTLDQNKQQQINNETIQKGNELWQLLNAPVKEQQTAVMATVVTSVNDVLNSTIYTQAAWTSRIPPPAWYLMFVISLGCCILIGYGSKHNLKGIKLTIIFPLVISFSFMLIADIDSTQGGMIYVDPQNLVNITHNIQSH